jgi:hypothetical protein
VANNYKTDKGKPPLLDALRPFAPALVALAAMMEDMKHKHRLAGAKDPFNEWRQLPDVQARLGNGLARHMIEHDPWSLNVADALQGTPGHLHATHALFNLLGALTKHLEAGTFTATHTGSVDFPRSPEDMTDRAVAMCCGAPDASHVPAGADWGGHQRRAQGRCLCGHSRGHHFHHLGGTQCAGVVGVGATAGQCTCPEYREE